VALEQTRREHAAVREALTSKSDDEIVAHSVALIASLDDIDALLATLPHGPVEPSLLRLELDEGALLSSLRTAGTVLAPSGVRAADVAVRGLPTTVRPSRPLQFKLALSDDYPSRAPAELEAAAASLAFHARIDVVLQDGAVAMPLIATLAPSPGGGFVTVSAVIPKSVGRGAEVLVNPVTVAGQLVAGGQALPARVHAIRGMHAPLVLAGADACNPTISFTGTLYAPSTSCHNVMMFVADSSPLSAMDVADLGMLNYMACTAFVDDASGGTLLLAGYKEEESNLAAVDAASRAVRWSICAWRHLHWRCSAACAWRHHCEPKVAQYAPSAPALRWRPRGKRRR
jgi:hypothetical protein